MSQLNSNASVNDEIVRGTTRFRFDGAKWKRLGQNFDTTAIANVVAEQLANQSYSGHLETVADKTYTIDAKVIADRTVTEFYGVAGTGSCTASLVSGGATLGNLSVSTSGATASLSNTGLSAGVSLDMVVSGNSSCEEFKFVIGYSQ